MPHEKLIEEIKIEVNKIEKLFKDYEPLLKKVLHAEPDFVELGSLAMLLHSFYNGLENIFHRITRKVDKVVLEGENWHQELLELMSRKTSNRCPVLTKSTCDELKKYLGFRHFSRHAYAFDLDWNLMKDLIYDLIEIKKKIVIEIELFISNINKKN